MPFPEGAVTSLTDVGISGHRTAWLPMQTWPDGSVRMAQAQFTDLVSSSTTASYNIRHGISALSSGFTPNSWVESMQQDIQFGARVQDAMGVSYEAVASLGGETVQSTELVRVRRQRLYHQAVAGQTGIGRDFLTSTFYVTEFREMPWVVVDWILGNDYVGADSPANTSDPNLFPLGKIDLDRAEFLTRGATDVQTYLPTKHAIGNRVDESSGWQSFLVMTDTFLDDGQTRRYRFFLSADYAGATSEVRNAWAQRFDAFVSDPMYAMPTLTTWQKTEGMGVNGGPVTGPADAAAQAQSEYDSWQNANHFGTWGTFGDVKYTHTTGTPRNAPVSVNLAHAAQGGHHGLLQVLEQKAWAQAMRPYHLFGLQVASNSNLLLWKSIPYKPGGQNISKENLGRKKLWQNDPYVGYRTRANAGPGGHGWNGYDSEHWTTDLLFDYWSISGDAWAKEELRQLGQSLKGLMSLDPQFLTSNVQAARAEGWTMTGLVQCFLATGDSDLEAHAEQRIDTVIEPNRQKFHASKALMFQNSHGLTGYPTPHKFFMPWQHGPVLLGFLAAHKHFENANALKVAEDVPEMMDYSSVTNVNHATHGFVAKGLRYYVPTEYNSLPVPADYFDSTVGMKLGSSPLGGVHVFLISGLFQLANRTQNAAIRTNALTWGDRILGGMSTADRWYKWNLLVDEALATP